MRVGLQNPKLLQLLFTSSLVFMQARIMNLLSQVVKNHIPACPNPPPPEPSHLALVRVSHGPPCPLELLQSIHKYPLMSSIAGLWSDISEGKVQDGGILSKNGYGSQGV